VSNHPLCRPGGRVDVGLPWQRGCGQPRRRRMQQRAERKLQRFAV